MAFCKSFENGDTNLCKKPDNICGGGTESKNGNIVYSSVILFLAYHG